MDGLRFWNLAEVRYFLKKIDQGVKEAKSPIISDEIWDAAKQQTFQKYANSQALPYLHRSLQVFEQTNRAKYYSDLREFMFESSVEDFCEISKSDIVVSTIHKAKGHEFDHVLMLITHPEHPTDEKLRQYYVGITRAKHTLAIHPIAISSTRFILPCISMMPKATMSPTKYCSNSPTGILT